MKPLSELVNKWRELQLDYSGKGYQVAARRGCADELDAWLREADAWLDKEEKAREGDFYCENDVSTDDVRRDLLGTTRVEELLKAENP